MQFILYVAISSIAAIVNLLVGFSLYSFFGLATGALYSLAVAIGYLTGMFVNWSLNRVITFPRSGRPMIAEFRTFLLVATIGLLLTTGVATLFRNTLAPHLTPLVARSMSVPATIDATAHCMAVAVVAVYSFVGHKWLTFARGIRYQLARLSPLVLGPLFSPGSANDDD